MVATAQTGTGKTLAFVLPIINLLEKDTSRSGVRALILSPTRELAIQINETFVKIAAGTPVRTAVVVGGLNERMQLQCIKKRRLKWLSPRPAGCAIFSAGNWWI